MGAEQILQVVHDKGERRDGQRDNHKVKEGANAAANGSDCHCGSSARMRPSERTLTVTLCRTDALLGRRARLKPPHSAPSVRRGRPDQRGSPRNLVRPRRMPMSLAGVDEAASSARHVEMRG
eukprot:ctg_433.g251